jgi:lactate dehydrogenase-like 2-hydroxyacid dehydrogenase
MPIGILLVARFEQIARRLTPEFAVHHLPAAPERAQFLAETGPQIRGIVTSTAVGVPVDAALLAALPNVEIIANMWVGYDTVDMTAARARGIIVTNAGAANAIDVAEHAFGLILDIARGITAGDRYVRAGAWRAKGRMPLTHRIAGRKLGIAGLGNIGLEIATRATAFGMTVMYHNRKPRLGLAYEYLPTLVELARQVDFLVVATPGGPATRHLIDRDVIDALGADGVLINVGRGSVVDEAALVTALEERRLGGAGLDVFQNEPLVPEALLPLPNVILQPHVAGATYEGAAAAMGLVVDNLRAHFAGKPPLTPVH